jgi:periplasmic mercuric ion binding protein
MHFRRFAPALIAALALLPLSAALAADVKVSGIHNCCPMCTDPLTAALTNAGATDVKAAPTEVSFSAPDAATADKAVKALFDAGFAGKVEGAKAPEVAKVPKAKNLKIVGLHNCCGQCAKAIREAIKPFTGTNPALQGGILVMSSDKDIDADAVLKALRDKGYSGRIEKK